MCNTNILDLPIGFRFVHEGAILEVRRSQTCSRCYFDNNFGECQAYQFVCSNWGREDKTNVNFIKITDIPKITKK